MPEIEEFAQRLRDHTVAIKFAITRLGTTRKMTGEQQKRVAELFGADTAYVTGGKRLINTKNSRWKAVSRVLSQAHAIWKSHTFPFPDSMSSESVKGVRMLRKDKIEELEAALNAKLAELAQAEDQLQAVWEPEILPEARAKLSQLHMQADYPKDIRGLFGFEWSFVSVEPPSDLEEMHKELFERERERVGKMFEVAVHMQEQALAVELNKLVATMLDKLRPGEDGQPKKFTRPNLENFTKFFESCRQMNLGSNEDLNIAITRAEEAMDGVEKDNLNKNVNQVRDTLRESMERLSSDLDDMIVPVASRRIVVTRDDPPEQDGEETADEEPSAEETAESLSQDNGDGGTGETDELEAQIDKLLQGDDPSF